MIILSILISHLVSPVHLHFISLSDIIFITSENFLKIEVNIGDTKWEINTHPPTGDRTRFKKSRCSPRHKNRGEHHFATFDRIEYFDDRTRFKKKSVHLDVHLYFL